MKEATSLAIILAILLASHLTLITILGQPLGVDTWPLINMAQKTIENPSLHLTSDQTWDKHNNRWPGIVSLSIILTKTLGTTTLQTYMYALPFTLELAIVLGLYTFYKRITKKYASLGVGITVFSPPIYMFLQEPIKEILSAAIALTLTLLLLATKIDRGIIIPLLIFTLGMTVSHPLPPLMLTLIGLTTILLAKTLHAINHEETPLKHGIIASLLAIAVTYIAYNLVFGFKGTSYAALIRDYILVYLLYLYLATALYIFYNTTTNRLTGTATLLIIATGTAGLLLGTHFLPRISQAETGYTLYIASFLIALLPTLTLAYMEKDEDYPLVKHVSGAALLVAGSMVLFMATYAQIIQSIIYRILHYLYPFIGLTAAYATRKTRLIPILTLIFLVITSLFLTALVIQDRDPVRYIWRYTTQETSGYQEIARLSNKNLLGDQKTQYYYTYLHQVNQPISQQGTKIVGKGLLIIYKDMLRYGFWNSPANIINPQTVKQATQNAKGTVYNDGVVEATLLG